MSLDELPIDERRARKRHQFEQARACGALTRLARCAAARQSARDEQERRRLLAWLQP